MYRALRYINRPTIQAYSTVQHTHARESSPRTFYCDVRERVRCLYRFLHHRTKIKTIHAPRVWRSTNDVFEVRIHLYCSIYNTYWTLCNNRIHVYVLTIPISCASATRSSITIESLLIVYRL